MTEQLKQTPFEIPKEGSPVTQSYLHELSAPGEGNEKDVQREKYEEAEETFLALESLYRAPEGEKEEDKNTRRQRREGFREQMTAMIKTDRDTASHLVKIAAWERMLRGTDNGLSAEESLYPGSNQPTRAEELVDSAFGDTYGWGDQLSEIRDQAVEDFRAWQQEQLTKEKPEKYLNPEGYYDPMLEYVDSLDRGKDYRDNEEDMLDDQKSENEEEDAIDELAGQFVDIFSRSNVEVDLEKVKSLFRPGEAYDPEAEHVYDLNFDQIWNRLGIDAKAIGQTQKQELLDNGALEMLGKLVEPSLRRDLNRIDLESMINEQNIAVQSGVEGMTAKEVSRTLQSVLADPESRFHQGYNWNVLLSEHSPYAVKFIKNNRTSYESALDEIENYGTLEDVLGEEFMLPQVVVELGNTRRQVVLQQKLDLDDWQPVTAYKGKPPELDKALADPNNRQSLDKFLAGVMRLENEHRLAVDLSGDNVFCRIDDEGRLEIKLLDYGCLDVDNPHHQEGIDSTRKFAAELANSDQG